jgi:hypothetical protein
VKLWLREYNPPWDARPLLRRFWLVWAGAITKTTAATTGALRSAKQQHPTDEQARADE